MLLLTRRLDKFGLRVNQKKIVFWSSSKLIQYRCRDIQKIFAKKTDRKNKDLILRFVTNYLLLTDDELNLTWNNGVPLLNRLLWADIEKLSSELFEQVFQKLIYKKFLQLATSKQLIRISELNNHRKCPINLNLLIKEIAGTSVHNSFHYEALFYARELKDNELEAFLDKRIERLNIIIQNNVIE